MDLWDILLNILLLLVTALILGALCERFRQSAILGYLLAGALLGPKALNVVPSMEIVDVLAELGVSLLLFAIGLDFSWSRLRRLGRIGLAGGALQVVITLLVFAAAAAISSTGWRAAVLLGAAVSLSSTATVLRLVMARTEIESPHGRCVLGVLLFQDLAVIPLVLLVGLFREAETAGQSLWSLGQAAALLGALAGGFWVTFDLLMPRLLHLQVMLENRELPVLMAVVAGLGAAWATHGVGLSPAIGAFIAGMMLGESPFARLVRSDIAVLRTLLMTLFFSSIGMLADPVWMLRNLPAIALSVLVVVGGKTLLVWPVLRALGQPRAVALAAGLCLAQVGEFGFVLARAAPPELMPESRLLLFVATMMATLFLSPFLVAGAVPLARFVTRLPGPGAARKTHAADRGSQDSERGQILLVGYGPAGEEAASAVRSLGLPVVVLDLNPRLALRAREDGFAAHVGDATHGDALEQADLAMARAVIVTLPDPVSARTVVSVVSSMAPHVPVIARARYNRYRDELERSGAHAVVDEERQVGLHLAACVREILEGAARSRAAGEEVHQPPL